MFSLRSLKNLTTSLVASRSGKSSNAFEANNKVYVSLLNSKSSFNNIANFTPPYSESKSLVIFYNDVYCNYQKPFFICKKCAINKINTTPAFDRIIPKLLVRYYEGTEEFKRFIKTSNRIL